MRLDIKHFTDIADIYSNYIEMVDILLDVPDCFVHHIEASVLN